MNKTLTSYTLSIFVIDLNQILVRMLGKPIKQMKAYRYLMSKLFRTSVFARIPDDTGPMPPKQPNGCAESSWPSLKNIKNRKLLACFEVPY